jgi:YidC/Oxa1 family membrane protein insertase
MNDRNRTLLFVVLAAAIVFAWPKVMTYFGWLPDPARQVSNDPATSPATGPGMQSAVTGPASTQPYVSATPPVPTTGLRVASTTAATPDLLLGSAVPADPTFALQLRVSPSGGGVSRVEVNDYKQLIKSEQRFTFEQPAVDAIGASALSIRSITVNGQRLDLAPANWRVVTQGTDHAALALDVVGDNGLALELTSRFTVPPRDDKQAPGAGGFETTATYAIRNTGTQPATVSAVIVGPVMPATEQPLAGGDRHFLAGYKGRNAVVLAYDTFEVLTKDQPTKEYAKKDEQPLLWFGGGSAYFSGITRPTGDWLVKANATLLTPDHKLGEQQVELALQTRDFSIAPQQQADLDSRVFFGPRRRDVMDNAYYAAANVGYQHVLEISGSCAWCTFQSLVGFLMKLLAFFHWALRDWGMAIIALVLVVRGVLHPITKRSQINMAKMSKFGPELERIKKKYGDDKEGQQRAMLDFYKTHGATPVLGCLPMFLQMPIWIALYSGLSTTFELRQEPFFYGLTWIQDLARPDHLIEFRPENYVQLFFFRATGINVIPFLLAIAFSVQFKLQPKMPTTTPEQEQQQKMMKWITTFLFPLMLYSMPSGLTIYILTSTVLGIIESKIIRKHITQQERLAGDGPVIIDAEIVSPHRQATALPAKKAGGVIGFFQKLQEGAEKMREDAEKKARQKKR